MTVRICPKGGLNVSTMLRLNGIFTVIGKFLRSSFLLRLDSILAVIGKFLYSSFFYTVVGYSFLPSISEILLSKEDSLESSLCCLLLLAPLAVTIFSGTRCSFLSWISSLRLIFPDLGLRLLVWTSLPRNFFLFSLHFFFYSFPSL